MQKLFLHTDEVIVQGMTGKEGTRMATWMMKGGTNVVAGVTPGKGGQEVEGKPIFHDLASARAAFPNARVSCVAVPAPFVLAAAEDALKNGITFLYILSETVPVEDVIRIRELAKAVNATVLGPSSVGYLQFPRFRLGYLGGNDPFATMQEGNIAVLSTSGGMTNELMMGLVRENEGIRLAIALGGDRIPCFPFEEALNFCHGLDEIKRLLLFIEPGQPILKKLTEHPEILKKPTVICLPGDALEDLPKGMSYGHTGTILEENAPSLKDIRAKLIANNIPCFSSPQDTIHACTSIKYV